MSKSSQEMLLAMSKVCIFCKERNSEDHSDLTFVKATSGEVICEECVSFCQLIIDDGKPVGIWQKIKNWWSFSYE